MSCRRDGSADQTEERGGCSVAYGIPTQATARRMAFRQAYVKLFQSSVVYTAMLKRHAYRILHDEGFELPQSPDCFSLSKRQWEVAASTWRNKVKALAAFPTKTVPKKTKILTEAHTKQSKPVHAAKAIVFVSGQAGPTLNRLPTSGGP